MGFWVRSNVGKGLNKPFSYKDIKWFFLIYHTMSRIITLNESITPALHMGNIWKYINIYQYKNYYPPHSRIIYLSNSKTNFKIGSVVLPRIFKLTNITFLWYPKYGMVYIRRYIASRLSYLKNCLCLHRHCKFKDKLTSKFYAQVSFLCSKTHHYVENLYRLVNISKYLNTS